MTLEPDKKPGERRRFLAWDLEWMPGSDLDKAARTCRACGLQDASPQSSPLPRCPSCGGPLGLDPLELRICGVYDGQRYRDYTSIGDFLNGEMIPETSGSWYYAHAGGLYDLNYVFEWLVENRGRFEVHAAFSGSSAIITKLERGGCHWYFVDSFWLMRAPLAKIARMVGMEKGGKENFWASYSQLREYNEQDVRILWHAIAEFERVLESLGGVLEKTVASSAMRLFRRQYLKRTIKTDPLVNAVAGQAYIASRVEPYQKHVEMSNYYDINSSFPYSMTFPQPGEYKGKRKRIPKGERPFLAKCQIHVPNMHVPPLPYRAESGGIHFPVGTWTNWFSRPDIETLEECGGRIVKVEDVMVFDAFSDLSDYALDIYEKRKNAGSAAENQILKILLNSLYGKFAEAELKTSVFIDPSAKFLAEHPEVSTSGGGEGRVELMPGVWQLRESKEVPHAHVPIAQSVTAMSRRWLTQYMHQASDIYYCDTDGFAIPGGDFLPESNELGGLKLEKFIREGRFAAPKLYAYQTPGPWQERQGWTVKAKGFSRIRHEGERDGSPITYDDFLRLLDGRELMVEQFARIKSGMRKKQVGPAEYLVPKRLRGVARTKRRELPDGTSVPWDVRELLPAE